MSEIHPLRQQLFTAHAALLGTAEVSTGEAKPELFPQDILRLDDAPRKLTKQVRPRLDPAKLDRAKLQTLRPVIEAHKGAVTLFLALRLPGGQTAGIGPDSHFSVAPPPPWRPRSRPPSAPAPATPWLTGACPNGRCAIGNAKATTTADDQRT